MEGMQAFARRHFDAPAARHARAFVCVDTVGSPELMLLEGEGMLVMRDYDAAFKDARRRLRARGAGVAAAPRAALPLRHRRSASRCAPATAAAMIGSINRYKVPANYHWPTRHGRQRRLRHGGRRRRVSATRSSGALAAEPAAERAAPRASATASLGASRPRPRSAPRQLARAAPELRAGVDAELARELVAAHQRRGGAPAARQRQRVGEHLARELQVPRDRLRRPCGPRVASRSATDSSVTSTSTGAQSRR